LLPHVGFLIKGVIITIVILHPLDYFIGVGGGGDCGRDPCSRRRHNSGIGGDLLTHLLFLIRVAEDDDLAITRWPQDSVVKVTEESSGKLCIPRSIGDEALVI
jgi:hypothetical protein